jgi:hypothetical protein
MRTRGLAAVAPGLLLVGLAACSHHRSVAGTYVASAAGFEIALTLHDDGTWTGQIWTGKGGGTFTVEDDTVVLQLGGKFGGPARHHRG